MNFFWAAVWAAVGFWIWPTGITDTPFAQLTLSMLGAALVSVVSFVACFNNMIEGK